MSFRHIDFFSGAVSGFSFAASHVWPNCEHVAFCEIDPWRREQLRRIWPGVPIIEDINDEEAIANIASVGRGARGAESAGQGRECGASKCGCECSSADAPRKRSHGSGKARRRRHESSNRIDLATLSPPCQSSSCAGLRLGTEDPRWLWPQALKAVEITKPQWCIFENPTGFLSIDGGMAYESVVSDLEGKGYWVESFIIPASAVGAWHRRNRVWIVAHLEEQNDRECDGEKSIGQKPESGIGVVESVAADPKRGQGREYKPERGSQGRIAAVGDNQQPTTDAFESRLERHSGNGKRGNESGRIAPGQERPITESYLDMHWLQAVESFCGMVDGLSAHDPDRTKWIAALGDSVVPQVPAKIMEAIKNADGDTDYAGNKGSG